MIRHVVLWTLKEHGDGAGRAENALRLKARLESLPARIPQLRSLEAGVDVGADARGWHVALVATFDSKADLAAYQAHPEHQRLVEWLGLVREQRAVVDYRLP